MTFRWKIFSTSFFVSFIICTFLLFTIFGCASETAHKQYAESYEKTASMYYATASKPLLDLTLPAPNGQEYHLVVANRVDPLEPKQIKDSEWVGPVQGLINAAGIVGGLAVVSSGAGTKTESIGGDKVSGAAAQKNTPTTTTTTTIIGGEL